MNYLGLDSETGILKLDSILAISMIKIPVAILLPLHRITQNVFKSVLIGGSQFGHLRSRCCFDVAIMDQYQTRVNIFLRNF